MHILSYRGPGMAGGVSAALSRLWNAEREEEDRWWHMLNSVLSASSEKGVEPEKVRDLSEEVIAGHYRYCNEFLWPVMHDLPEYATYRYGDRHLYQQFNLLFAESFGEHAGTRENTKCFVQDYQLALMPALLGVRYKSRSQLFWHIPWPRKVQQMHVPPLVEIAKGLLAAEVVGFHTKEYADNFMDFVSRHIPSARTDRGRMLITEGTDSKASRHSRVFNLHRARHRRPPVFTSGSTRVAVAPLGLDLEYWSGMASNHFDLSDDYRFDLLRNYPYVLSVDRGDYTKGVNERFKAIDRFFEQNPEWREKMVFAQICGRTRPGLQGFDSYWTHCKELAARVDSRWATGQWHPILWISSPVGGEDLSALYRQAKAMLVNPVRDGLNLTAKEFVACQAEDPGVLLLSPEAGAWHELGQAAVPVNPYDSEQMASSIASALSMGEAERALRRDLMQHKIGENTLDGWWKYFAGAWEEKTSRSHNKPGTTTGFSSIS